MLLLIVVVLILAGLAFFAYSRNKTDQKENPGGEEVPVSRAARAERAAAQKSMDPEAESEKASGTGHDLHNPGQNQSMREDRAAEKKIKEKTAAKSTNEKAAVAEDTEGRQNRETGNPARRTSKPRPVRTEKEEASSEIYDCINKGLRKISVCWEKGELDQLKELGTLSLSVRKYYDDILEGLQEEQKEMLRHYRDAVDLEEKDGRLYVSPREDADLEKVLFDAMMPFYPYYGKELQAGGIRYGSMLSKETLSLFYQLTGRKFRIGFHRRYRSGVDSFDWKDNHYQVRDSEGRLYCDADFEDGKVVSGYAKMPADQDSDDNWKVYQAGIWEDGCLKDGTICYQYQKKVR